MDRSRVPPPLPTRPHPPGRLHCSPPQLLQQVARGGHTDHPHVGVVRRRPLCGSLTRCAPHARGVVRASYSPAPARGQLVDRESEGDRQLAAVGGGVVRAAMRAVPRRGYITDRRGPYRGRHRTAGDHRHVPPPPPRPLRQESPGTLTRRRHSTRRHGNRRDQAPAVQAHRQILRAASRCVVVTIASGHLHGREDISSRLVRRRHVQPATPRWNDQLAHLLHGDEES